MDSDTNDIIYRFVCKNLGLNTYEIAKKLNMSGGKVRYSLSSLKKMGLIKFKFERQSARIQKLTYPVKAFDLLPKNLKSKLKKMKNSLR